MLEEATALVPVGAWPSLAEAHEHALVVLAMNRECLVHAGDGLYALHAEPDHAAAIRREFELYAAEQSERREPAEPPLFPAGVELAMLWIAALVGMFVWQGRDPALTDRLLNSNLAVFDGGEWWRPFTALFLHADAAHLLGNLGIGGLFCVMVAKSIGALRGWALILAAGTLGNAINAWLHLPESFRSLGASTATFGAVGILVGVFSMHAWRAGSYRRLRPLLGPVMVGLVVLGWYGTGGGQQDGVTDVAGHVAGWSCGVALGAAVAATIPFEEEERAA